MINIIYVVFTEEDDEANKGLEIWQRNSRATINFKFRQSETVSLTHKPSYIFTNHTSVVFRQLCISQLILDVLYMDINYKL